MGKMFTNVFARSNYDRLCTNTALGITAAATTRRAILVAIVTPSGFKIIRKQQLVDTHCDDMTYR